MADKSHKNRRILSLNELLRYVMSYSESYLGVLGDVAVQNDAA